MWYTCGKNKTKARALPRPRTVFFVVFSPPGPPGIPWGPGNVWIYKNIRGPGIPWGPGMFRNEKNQKWIIVDTGVSFADDSIPGIDLIYPDPQHRYTNHLH